MRRGCTHSRMWIRSQLFLKVDERMRVADLDLDRNVVNEHEKGGKRARLRLGPSTQTMILSRRCIPSAPKLRLRTGDPRSRFTNFIVAEVRDL